MVVPFVVVRVGDPLLLKTGVGTAYNTACVTPWTPL
jgi:hypothetical protein